LADVFISYSQKDKPIAAQLAGKLCDRGLDVWWDTAIVGGENFRSAILKQLELSKVVLVLWSSNSIGSRFVLDEADEAAATGKLISILVGGLQPKYIPMGFGSFQAVRIDEDDRLVRALKGRGLMLAAPGVAAPMPIDELAIEHTAWTFVQDRNDPKLLEEYLSQFPNGKFTFMARRRLTETKWKKLSTSSEIAEIEKFVSEHPDSDFAAEASARIKELRSAEAAREETERRAAKAARKAKEKKRAAEGARPSYGGQSVATTEETSGKELMWWLGGAVVLAILATGMCSRQTPSPTVSVSRDDSIRTFNGHSKSVASVAFSPDYRTALSGGYDSTVILWEVDTGKELKRFEVEPGLRSFAFSPDFGKALTGSENGWVAVWDVKTGKRVGRFQAASNAISSLAFSPDGRWALSGGGDVLKLWEVATGKLLRDLPGHQGSVNAIAFSSDGRFALSGSDDRTIRVWEVADTARRPTGKFLRMLAGHQAPISTVAFSPDGVWAVSGNLEKDPLKLWEIATGKPSDLIDPVYKEYRDWQTVAYATSVVFSSDGGRVLSGSDRTTNLLKLWDVKKRELLRSFAGHSDSVNSVAISRNGDAALSGSADTTLKLWKISEEYMIEIPSFRSYKGIEEP
jgi:hypothetical protein